MENGMTKIAELPMNGGGGGNQQQHQEMQSLPTVSVSEMKRKNDSNVQTNYAAINMHPNPYGIPEQNNVMQNPENQRMEKQNIQMEMFQNNDQQVGTGLPEEYRNQIESMPSQRLPSRDIPMNSNHLEMDEEVQPNYIPRPSKKDDYVRNRSNEFENELYEYEQQKYRESQLDDLLDDVCEFEKKYENVAHHTISFGKQYEEHLKKIFEKKVLSDDISFYLHRPSATDPIWHRKIMMHFMC